MEPHSDIVADGYYAVAANEMAESSLGCWVSNLRTGLGLEFWGHGYAGVSGAGGKDHRGCASRAGSQRGYSTSMST